VRSISPHPENGWAGIAVLLLLLGLAASLFVASNQTNGSKTARNEITIVALATAKQALIAYTVSRDWPHRPGEFPCPTQEIPGTSFYGNGPSSCATGNLIGRLPWRELGIPELVDGSGEPLWYALSNPFKPVGTVSTATAITSSTRGNLSIRSADGSSVIENEVVAVIFSAGGVLPGQVRSPANLTCATTGTSRPANMCAANYLESIGASNNASSVGPFVNASSSADFNDRLSVITTADFMPKIEARIAADLEQMISQYYQATGYYPNAAYFGDVKSATNNSMRSVTFQAVCSTGVYVGHLPADFSVNPPNTCVGQSDWKSVAGIKTMRGWFYDNGWPATIYYAVGKAFTLGGSKLCTNIGDCLNVNGITAIQAIVILPGTPTSTQVRPVAADARSGLDIRNYLEETENLDGWSVTNNWTYASTPPKSPSTDRLIIFKASLP
jgi:hypothetical protein